MSQNFKSAVPRIPFRPPHRGSRLRISRKYDQVRLAAPFNQTHRSRSPDLDFPLVDLDLTYDERLNFPLIFSFFMFQL